MSLPGRAVNDTAALVECVVVFGGTDVAVLPISVNSSLFNDLWALKVATWEWVLVTSNGTAPPARYSHAALQTRQGNLVVHGGASGDGDHLRDMWLFEASTATWQELTPWFQPEAVGIFDSIVRATYQSLDFRDRWGHTGVLVAAGLQSAEAFLLFGGLNSEQYFSYTIATLTEYVYGMAPSDRNLMLWTDDVFSGPFQRSEHAAARLGRPRQGPASVPTCNCLPMAWTWQGSEYFGCARPLGLDEYICPVLTTCPTSNCWNHYGEAGTYLGADTRWDFCSEDRVVIHGGAYDGDADHLTVADPDGVVWIYDVKSQTWQMDELLHVLDHPTPGPIYQYVGFRRGAGPGPSQWANQDVCPRRTLCLFLGCFLLGLPPYCAQDG
jgi:hypothetical protein